MKFFTSSFYAYTAYQIREMRRSLYWRAMQYIGVLLNNLHLLVLALKITVSRGKTRFVIARPYGRTGNNIQQIVIAIAHAEAFRGSLDVDPEIMADGRISDFVYPFSLDFSPCRFQANEYRAMFFHYTEYTFSRTCLSRLPFKRGVIPRRECMLSRGYIEHNAWRIAQSYLLPKIFLPESEAMIEDRLVLHLRSGDVADLSYDHYITNPLCYYKYLASRYKDVLIVKEPGPEHVLLQSILSLFQNAEVVSGSVNEDFHRLRNARHLATSGVGTFAISACLLSCTLQILHCTDLFQIEHLNPLMLIGVNGVNVDLIKLPRFPHLWLKAKDRRQLLLCYETSRVGV